MTQNCHKYDTGLSNTIAKIATMFAMAFTETLHLQYRGIYENVIKMQKAVKDLPTGKQ